MACVNLIPLGDLYAKCLSGDFAKSAADPLLVEQPYFHLRSSLNPVDQFFKRWPLCGTRIRTGVRVSNLCLSG